MEETTVDKSKITLKLINKNVAKELIIKNHYTHQCSQATIPIGPYVPPPNQILNTATSNTAGTTKIS